MLGRTNQPQCTNNKLTGILIPQSPDSNVSTVLFGGFLELLTEAMGWLTTDRDFNQSCFLILPELRGVFQSMG